MATRLFHLTEWDVYRMYNIEHPGYPDRLPPPPNPERLLAFYFKLVEKTVEQMNKENNPEQNEPPHRRQMRP